MIIKLRGRLHSWGKKILLPGSDREAMKMIIEVTYNDARMRTDYYPIVIYGKDDIWNSVKDHNDKIAKQECIVTVKLTGRIKNGRESLTLTFKSIEWLT
jgi:predicted phage tail protein